MNKLCIILVRCRNENPDEKIRTEKKKKQKTRNEMGMSCDMNCVFGMGSRTQFT